MVNRVDAEFHVALSVSEILKIRFEIFVLYAGGNRELTGSRSYIVAVFIIAVNKRSIGEEMVGEDVIPAERPGFVAPIESESVGICEVVSAEIS